MVQLLAEMLTLAEAEAAQDAARFGGCAEVTLVRVLKVRETIHLPQPPFSPDGPYLDFQVHAGRHV